MQTDDERQRHTFAYGHAKTFRSGYTLVELLIVMAILVLIASLSWPSLRRSLEKSRLESAARDVQQELNRARTNAIKTGTGVELVYTEGSHDYSIRPVREGWRSLTPTAFSDPGSTSQLSATSLPDDREPKPLMTGRELALPASISFANTPSGQGTGGTNVESELSAARLTDAGADVDSRIQPPDVAKESVTFQPNGQCLDATIELVSVSGYSITVSVRGTTGVASVSTVRVPTAQSLATESDSAIDAGADEAMPDTRSGR